MAKIKSFIAFLTLPSIQICAVSMWFCLLLIVIGLARFGYDLWNYLHSSGATSIALDYTGLWIASFSVLAGGLLFGAAYLLESLWRAWGPWERRGRRNEVDHDL